MHCSVEFPLPTSVPIKYSLAVPEYIEGRLPGSGDRQSRRSQIQTWASPKLLLLLLVQSKYSASNPKSFQFLFPSII